MRSLAGEPISQTRRKNGFLPPPTGHKEKLGEGGRELHFVRPNHSVVGHLVKQGK